MNNFEKTNEWLRKTSENASETRAYNAKVANGESTEAFNVIERRLRHGTKRTLIVSHNINTYDETINNFITETIEMVDILKNKISELEDQISELKK